MSSISDYLPGHQFMSSTSDYLPGHQFIMSSTSDYLPGHQFMSSISDYLPGLMSSTNDYLPGHQLMSSTSDHLLGHQFMSFASESTRVAHKDMASAPLVDVNDWTTSSSFSCTDSHYLLKFADSWVTSSEQMWSHCAINP
ncbi:hypothetical protein BsWGS_11257 [Bradybaena similaris]